MQVHEFDFPDQLKYLKGNLWVKKEKNFYVLGLTSLGASLAKEIVHIDLPQEGKEFSEGETIASFETIKSVSSITLPFRCVIKKINRKLLDNPTLINVDCYGSGWMFKFTAEETKDLMDVREATAYYKKIIEKEKKRYEGVYD